MHLISPPGFVKPILLYDVSGQGRMDDNWKAFLPEAEGIVYVVDSCDRERLKFAKEQIEELFFDSCTSQKITSDISKQGLPILIAMNKQDRQDALDKETLKELLGLGSLKTKLFSAKWTFRETSGFSGLGVTQSVDWLFQNRKIRNSN